MNTTVKTVLVSMALVHGAFSQDVNWRSLGEVGRAVVQLSGGYNFGAMAQVGYARSFSLITPVIVGVDYSFPMGRDLTDDFKVRLGGQVEILHLGGLSATIKLYGNFRRYQMQLVRIASFGSDMALVAGYSTPAWYAAGEFGFDKAIATHLKHPDLMKAVYPAIRDGWYVPTGGNYFYGIQGGKTIGESFEVTLRLGKTSAQDHDENAVIPLYLTLGIGVRL